MTIRPRTIRKAILIAAGSALILAFPVAAQAQTAPVPTADPAMAAPAASQPAAAVADQAPAADTAATKDYPPCSATVTDGCVQRGGGAKAHRGKAVRHKKG